MVGLRDDLGGVDDIRLFQYSFMNIKQVKLTPQMHPSIESCTLDFVDFSQVIDWKDVEYS